MLQRTRQFKLSCALSCKSKRKGFWGKRRKRLTKHKHQIKKYNHPHTNRINTPPHFPHPKRSLWNVFTASEEVGGDCYAIGCRCEDDKGADEVREGGFGTELDGAESGAEDCLLVRF